MVNTDIKINDVVYKGGKVITPSFESDIPNYRVDQGFSITDHIEIRPPKFEIELTLYDGHEGTTTYSRQNQYSAIFELWNRRQTFTFDCDLGTFTDMVITKFEPEQSYKSDNTYKCLLTIEKIIRATISLFATPTIRDPTSGALVDVGHVDGSGTEVALTVVDPLPDEEKSWAEKLYEWWTT